jgi:NAD kinase
MRVKILLDQERPKVQHDEVKRVLLAAGVNVTEHSADMGVVVGGDGVFSMFGRNETIPLLFVGVKSGRPTGSKAYLAAADFEELPSVMAAIVSGKHRIVESRRLEVFKNGKSLGDVFTDVYLQRGADSNCIRYHLDVKGDSLSISESAISDGVVVCTRAGSTGYFSYPDKLRDHDTLMADAHTVIAEGQVGICHILPTYTEREGATEHPLRYTVPWGSRIEIRIARNVDARLYGTSMQRTGVKIGRKDRIAISASPRTTRVVRLTGVASDLEPRPFID